MVDFQGNFWYIIIMKAVAVASVNFWSSEMFLRLSKWGQKESVKEKRKKAPPSDEEQKLKSWSCWIWKFDMKNWNCNVEIVKKKEKTRQITVSAWNCNDCIDCKRTFVEEIVPIVNELLSINCVVTTTKERNQSWLFKSSKLCWL